MRLRFAIFVFALLALAVTFVHAQTAKRLILKDGSYQTATKWEVKGDRVRYYSAERAEWEEVPASMVDWAATDKYEKDRASGKNAELEQALAAEEKDRQTEAEKNPQVAPGIRLPDGGGVFALDTYRGQPQLAELVQTGGEINKQTGKNILRAAINPISTIKQSIELKGAHARVQVHVPAPEIFLDIDMDTQADRLSLADHFRIVKLQEKKDLRVLGNLKITMIGTMSQQGAFIKTKAEKFSGDWIKVTPLEPLAPGEYAVVEMLTPKEMNLYVWDFGVNPSAPENPSAWKPEPVKQNHMGTDQSPILSPRTPQK